MSDKYKYDKNGVSVTHTLPNEDHPKFHIITVGEVGAHGRLIIRSDYIPITLHHDTLGNVVGVEVWATSEDLVEE